MSSITLLAGPRAQAIIEERGLRAEDVRLLVGASGGPKWFVLYQLDRYLFGEFFAGRSPQAPPLATLGTSAGAWRLACLALADPLAGIERLALRYSQQRYSARPDRREVSREARSMVAHVLGDSGAREIADNPQVLTHILADRSRSLLRSERTALLMPGLALCAAANALSRRSLAAFLERVVFCSRHQVGALLPFDDLPTQQVVLTAENVAEVLMASGAIPLVMEAVRGVPGLPQAVFRDGGILDYHFDLPFHRVDGLVLYPHFYASIVPGWFDKSLPWRRIYAENFDNVLLIAPSRAFVESLPYGKIPDRKDFEVLDADSRLRYWQQVLAAGERMAEELGQLIASDQLAGRLQPLTAHREHHL